jgi:hypothetical protein
MRGSQFYASEGERKEKGISLFEAFLAKKGVIRHVLCRLNHPQTRGMGSWKGSTASMSRRGICSVL